MMAGKGSAPRKGRDDQKYADNWDAIFGNKKKSINDATPEEWDAASRKAMNTPPDKE